MFAPVQENTREYTKNYYAATVGPAPVRPTLEPGLEADVCVIGGGLTGLGAALHLAKRGIKVVVLEKALVGWGASGRNGGQANTGMRKGQDELEHLFGVQAAKQFWQLSMNARKYFIEIIEEFSIDCDFRWGLLRVTDNPKDVGKKEEYARLLRDRYGYNEMRPLGADELKTIISSSAYCGGTLDTGSAHLHPLKLVQGMAKAVVQLGGQIFEQSPVVEVQKSGNRARVVTTAGSALVDQVILAGDVLLRGVNAQVESRVMPINSFVLATEQLPGDLANSLISNGSAVVDAKFLVNYFRVTKDNRLLFGGGETYSYQIPRDLKAFVRKRMLEVFPQLDAARIDYAWSGAIGITANRLPFVRRLDATTLVAAGYSGKGVMLAPYFGKVLAEAIDGSPSNLQLLSRLPSLPFPGGAILRFPFLVGGLSFYALRDRLGI